MRLRALDGLRGLAALVVLIHHAFLLVPSLAAPYFSEPVGGGRASLLVYTPLHLVWAGTEAVYLFFVLSGLVLGFAAQSASFGWNSYFPSRLARLYLPVFGAVVLGALVIWLTPEARPGESAWVERRPGDYDLGGMLMDAVLVTGSSNRITPLWSLQWEILFSLLLPVFIYAARRVDARIQLLAYFALTTLGAYVGLTTLKFLPMFGIGVALAAMWNKLSGRLDRMGRRTSFAFWTAGLLVAVVLLTAGWTTQSFLPIELSFLTIPVILIGVCIVILAATHAPVFSSLLLSRPFGFLGLISFSLYLVHEPIVVAVDSMVASPFQAILVAIPVSIAVAIGFWFVVERPSHRLARRIKVRAEAELRLAA
ncbi:acyltransferase family protein [Agromyces sp. MMS24-K17]|uniref:acyltransferase family protein n=1 Tax=Agromyces sp. MMS24-K17 TaxID=3372850 RepID=UPI00375509E0